MFERFFKPDVDALTRRGDAPGLVALLNHRDAALRARAAEALTGLPGAEAALVEALSRGVAGAARVLGARGEGRAALVQALDHPDMPVHQEARAALVRSREIDGLCEAAASGGVQAKTLALRGLVELKYMNIESILAAALQDPSEEVRRVAVQLGARPAALPEEPGARSSAISALAARPQPEDRPALREALASPVEQDRVSAVGGLALLGQHEALALALSDPSPAVRAEAARALGRRGVAGDRLVALLGDSHPHVRAAAADALGLLQDPAFRAPLLEALQGGNAAAARALGRIGDRRDVGALIAALDRPEVADLAAEALGLLGDPAAIPALRALVARWRRDPSLRGDDPDAADMARMALARLGG